MIRLRGNDDAPIFRLVDIVTQGPGYSLRGSVPSARPWTNSKPVISFCLSALTVPYVLLAIRLGIGVTS